jgi:secreted trypsin-like serine protease
MKKHIYLLLTLSLLSACQPEHHGGDSGVDEVTEEIVGGSTVTNMDTIAKHLVFIYRENDYSYCTGTIVAADRILTAAHCIKNPSETMTLGFGLDYTKGTMQVRYSTGAVLHKLFRKDPTTERNDIALISFSGGLPEGFEPAPLASEKIFAKIKSEIVAVGYGRIKGSNDVQPADSGYGRLRKVSLKIQSKSANGKTFEVSQQDGRGICYGDSGGPAFIKSNGRYYLVGVTSAVLWYKPKNSIYDLCKEHSIFMDVKFYKPWINSSSGQLL